MIRTAEEVRGARAVVGLETTLVAHGFPQPDGVRVGLAAEGRVRDAGAVPATVGVLHGEIRVGLAADELARFGPDARKAGPRDLAALVVRGETGATTVGGTLAVCRAVGIRVLATGGVGGVHRGWTERPDVSADLAELARTRAIIVCSGAKSLLDVVATTELLESLGIPVLGFRTDELPLFYRARGGPPLAAHVESAAEAAAVAVAHWGLGGAGLVLARPPEQSLEDVEPLIDEGLAEAARRGVAGQAVTPFVLAFLHERTGGRTLVANRELVLDNASLAAEVALEIAAREGDDGGGADGDDVADRPQP